MLIVHILKNITYILKSKINVYFVNYVTYLKNLFFQILLQINIMDIFHILNIDNKNTELESLKNICQKKIKLLHPDKNGGRESEQFLQVMKVWNILNDEKLFFEAKAQTLAKKSANWDTLIVSDMTFDETNELYFQDCRCGDQYILPKSEITLNVEEYCIECDSCSNSITVNTIKS